MEISRRKALKGLGVAAVGAPLSLSAQGRCMLTFGVPGCNTAEIKPLSLVRCEPSACASRADSA